MKLPTPRHAAAVVLTLALAACESRANRLLLVDYALSDPVTLEQTALPWRAAGYTVEYRRYFPHLTRDDLARYGSLIVLGGSEPDRPSDALTIGDLAILTEWARHESGGVVILGYGSGAQGRWVMNRWLEALGTGIAIQTDGRAHDRAVPQPRSALDNAGYASFAMRASTGLHVRDASQALARAPAGGTEPVALVAASRGEGRRSTGLIVVLNRQALAAPDASDAAAFLEALARWTRRPAEWAAVAAAERSPRSPLPLSLRGGPRSVAPDPPRRESPPGAGAVILPLRPAASAPTPTTAVPAWIEQQGMRVLWSDLTPRFRVIDSVLAFADLAALNAIATQIRPDALADSLPPAGRTELRTPWQTVAERLRATSFRWFPAIAFDDIPLDLAESPARGRRRVPIDFTPVTVADEVDRHGELGALPCGLDSLLWRGALRPALRALTRLGGGGTDVVTGIAIDLGSAPDGYAGMGFCGADWRAGIARLDLDSAAAAWLLALPPVARYDTLMHRGLLERYYAALEAAVAERAAALRAELRRLHGDLRFAVRAESAPDDWFSMGLLRGLSTPEVPLYLWTADHEVQALVRRYAEGGAAVLTAVRLEPRGTRNAEWRQRRPLAFGEHDGFWLPAAGADTVGRLLRRFVR